MQEIQSTNRVLMEAAGGVGGAGGGDEGFLHRKTTEPGWSKGGFKVQKATSTQNNSNTTGKCNQISSYKYVSVNSFCSGGKFLFFFVQPALMCACKRSLAGLAPAPLYRSASVAGTCRLGEQCHT